MIDPNLVGGAAATLGSLCWVPQLVKAWRTRHTADLSLIGLIVTMVMLVLWLVYGLMVGSMPLVLGNVVAIVLVGSILLAKILYG